LSLSRYRPHLLLAVALAMVAAAFSLPPIAQDAAYHRFIDARTLLGVPNFWNVASNLPFVIAGLLGLWRYHAVRAQVREPLRPAAIALFLGVLLVGFGSGWYHLAPSNASLVWDRLPMTVAFMALFALVLGVRIDTRLAQWLLWPLLVLGAASVVYWHVTELDGHGDLRPYALVQFLPVLLIPLVLWLYPGPGGKAIGLGLAWYVLAKLLEHYDARVFAALGGTISGHSLKHVAAALGMAALLGALPSSDGRVAGAAA
jgi:hypothetical protein